jgi:hypothetical protein
VEWCSENFKPATKVRERAISRLPVFAGQLQVGLRGGLLLNQLPPTLRGVRVRGTKPRELAAFHG